MRDIFELLQHMLDSLRKVVRKDPPKSVGETLKEEIRGVGAVAHFVHRRPTRFFDDGTADPDSYIVLQEGTSHNVVTKAGKDFILAQAYSAAPAVNGLNYIGLSNSAFTEDANSVSLSGEITANGLSRVQASSITHVAGTDVVTISKTFTCTTANQSAQKAALFSTAGPPVAGIMAHALPLSLQRNLAPNDTLQIVYTLTYTG